MPDDRFTFDIQTPRLFKISALTHEGTQDLVQQINQYLNEKKRLQAEADAANKIESSQPETQVIQTDTSIFKAE